MEIVQNIRPNLYLIFELLGLVSFLAILGRELYQKNEFRVYEIFSCLVFGMILEIGNTYLAHTYYYSPNFLIKIFNIPLAIGLWWAVIIYCVMLLSDQYRIPWTLRPLMDALTAVMLDLSFDPVAVRLGFWQWLIPLDQEWYGVPFENLVGWILVVLVFSYLVRYLRTLNLKRAWTRLLLVFSPLISYLGLAIGLTVYGFITIFPYTVSNWNAWAGFNYRPDFTVLYNPQVQLWKVIVLTIILVQLLNLVVRAIIKYRKKYTSHFDLVSFSVLSSIHVFIIASLFTTGMFRQEPVLVLMSLTMFAVHCLLNFLPHLLKKPILVYAFKRLGKTLDREEKLVEGFLDSNLK